MKKITVLIPCFNEEGGIGKVIDEIPRDRLQAIGYSTEVIVIDNNSGDRTAEIAALKGAKVLFEPKQGKGYAIITGFRNIPDDVDKVVMLDGDDTYRSSEMLRLIEPLDSGFCEVVIGTRLSGKIALNSMTYLNRVGNWLFTFLVRLAYHGNITDVCTGYFAWNKYVIDELVDQLESNGFSIEMEMVTKMAKMKYEMFSLPITYEDRNGTPSKLRPVRDGLTIFTTWVKNLAWRPKQSWRTSTGAVPEPKIPTNGSL